MPVALVGDVVTSREVADQSALLRRLADDLATVAEEVEAAQAPGLAIGDEFQGLYRDLAGALETALRLRLRLGIERDGLRVDVRVGLGAGAVEVSGAAALPAGQSGTAWWRARDAVDAARDLVERSQWPRSLRSVYRSGRDDEGPVMAYLLCQDEILGGADDRDRRILLGVLDGRPQAEIAAGLGISQPAVTKRLHEHGLVAVVRALESAGRRP